MWGKNRRICQEACYGCNHLKTDERHHNTCQMSDEECIRRFMERALCDVGCLELVREWYDGLPGLNPPLSFHEMMMFDTPWVLHQMERSDRITMLRELMIGPSTSYEELLETVPSMTVEELLETVPSMSDEELLETVPSMSDEELLEAVPSMSDEELLEAVEGVEGQPNDTNMLEENNAGMEEKGAFIRVNSHCYGCCHFLPSQEDHACCNFGRQEEPEEYQPLEEGVSQLFFYCFSFFFFALFFFYCSL